MIKLEKIFLWVSSTLLLSAVSMATDQASLATPEERTTDPITWDRSELFCAASTQACGWGAVQGGVRECCAGLVCTVHQSDPPWASFGTCE